MIIAGKYEVIGELGRGGMGVVYQARHIHLGAVYAVKTVPAHLAQDQDLVARFQQEARVMAALRHPNIVRVIDVGDDGALHFLIMECIEGETLRQVLQRAKVLPLGEALKIAHDVGSALHHAHQHVPAVIHRDIKPSNIIVERTTKRAVVTDFGIAKLIGNENAVHTQTGMLVGTMRYCAPEQLAGGAEIDGRVDLFSLGLMLYEMVTGRHPLDGLDEPRIVARALDPKTEYALEFDGLVPERVQQLIRRAVSKDRKRRHPDAGSLIVEIEQLLRLTTVDTLVSTSEDVDPLRASRWRAGAIAVTAMALLFAAVFTIGFVTERAGYWSRVGRTVATVAGLEGGAAAPQPPPVAVSRAVGVMEFDALNPDPSSQWMRDIIRDNLSSQLSAAADCKVFSKEFIDFKAQGLIKKGTYSDLRSATMKVAEELGVTKVIFGRYRANGNDLYIDAHVVDMKTGLQEPADQVTGEMTKFSDLQNQLATKIMARLDVRPAAMQIGESADIDGYKLLLDAEGGAQPPAPNDPKRKPGKDSAADNRDSLADRLLSMLTTGVAFAGEAGDDASQAAIRATLEKYRRAYEEKNLQLLAQVYGSLSAEQSGAATQYFATAAQLVVTIEDVDIAVDGEQAVVSYTRHDQFQDVKTGKPQNLQVRLTKRLVQGEQGWTIAQAAK